MSTSSENAAVILTGGEYPLQRQQAALIKLSKCRAIYDGDLSSAFQQITQCLGRVLNVERVSIWLYNAINLEIAQADLYELRRRKHSCEKKISLGNYPTYFKIFETQINLMVDDVQHDPRTQELLADWFTPWGITATIDVPICLGSQAVGRLWCEHVQTPRQWTIDEHNFAIHSANIISLAIAASNHKQTEAALQQQLKALHQQNLQLRQKIIENQRAEQAWQESQRFIQTIKETLHQQNLQLRRKIIENQQAEQAWQESQRFIQGIADASTSILYVYDLNADLIIYANRQLSAVLGYSLEEIQTLGGTFVQNLAYPDDLRNHQTEYLDSRRIKDGEVAEFERRVQHKAGKWRWLLIREAVFMSNEVGEPIQIIGNAADITDRKQAEATLQELNSELEKLATTDELTQLANRRCFDLDFNREWQRMRQAQTPLSLILCDIDCFKAYNDTYGHQAGDDCLQKVAAAIRQAAKRSTDLVARYGGEEFAVILANTDVDGAIQVAKRIGSAVKALQIDHGRSTVSQVVTISLGVATVIPDGEISLESLIALADKGLYQAKHKGRDRYCVQFL